MFLLLSDVVSSTHATYKPSLKIGNLPIKAEERGILGNNIITGVMGAKSKN